MSAAIDYFSGAKHNLFFRSLFLSLFQVYCEVADQSGVMSMVVWNDLCPEWFNRLTVGSVLYLQQYSLKHSYQKRSRPQIHTLSLMTFHSIGMNSRAFSKASFLIQVFQLGLYYTGSILDHLMEKLHYFSSLVVVVLCIVEICLNPRSPASVVTVIPPKSVQPQWGLPDVPYNFATRYTYSLANIFMC